MLANRNSLRAWRPAWHNRTDANGVKIWYTRQSLETAIEKLADSIDIQTRLLNKLINRLEHIEKEIEQKD
jgi:hypothetical protein